MNKLLFMFLLIGFLAFGQDDYLVSYAQGSTAAPEYFTANAATPSPGEVNSATGWADGPGTPTFSFSSVADPSDGSYAIKCTTNTNSTTGSGRLALTNMENGANYTITFDAKRNHGNWQVKLHSDDGWTTTQSTSFFGSSYTPESETATTNSTTVYLRIECTSFVSSGDYATIDYIKVNKN